MPKPLFTAWDKPARTNREPRYLEHRLKLAEVTLIELLASPEPDAELFSECILSATDERLGSIQHYRDRIRHLVALLNPPGEETQ